MPTLSTPREAKEYLVTRILAQAERDGVSLSDVEKKMLYFSETYWTLPDMADINREFDDHYDQSEYERKIAGIVRSIRRGQAADDSEKRSWEEAARALDKEDHYLLVLLDAAGPVRPRGDFIKLLLTATAIVCVMLAVMLFFANRS